MPRRREVPKREILPDPKYGSVTQGVPVLGLRTDELPAFYCRTSGFKLDYNCKDEETVAKIMKAKWDIGLKGGAVVGNPIPEQYAMDPNYMNGIIDKAAMTTGVMGC